MSDKLFIVGMPIAFSGGDADFSGITGSRDLWIADVMHKAHKAGLISIDEADRIWGDIISKKRKLPASSFSEYISKT